MQSPSKSRSIRPRHRVSLALLTAGFVLLALFSFTLVETPIAFADETNSADIFVQFDDSDTVIRSIQFTDPISGIQALSLSGLDVVIASTDFGPAVCSIEGVGCPVDNCFCDSKYWGYSYWADDAWQGYMVGAGSSVISQTSAIEGWRWGEFGDTLLAPTSAQSAQDALTWLRAQQVITDGGFGSMGASVEAAFAIGANREKASDWRAAEDAPSLATYVMGNAAGFADNNSAAAGKVSVANAATDICAGFSALRPSDYYSPTTGTYNENMGFHIWGVLGAMADGDVIADASIQAILDGPMDDGGWEWQEGFGSDTNTTAIAIQALVSAGESVTSTEIISGLAFIRSAQNDDGGITYDPNSSFGTDSDTNSTAYAVQAIIAAGQDPAGVTWAKSDMTPIDYLLGMQLEDGSFEWQPGFGGNVLATTQATTALLGNPYPISIGVSDCEGSYLPFAATE